MKHKEKNRRRKQQGFSLIEMMFAIVVLTIGILGSMMMVSIGVMRNNSNKVDTTATNAAQAVLEEIAGTKPNKNPTLVVTDCVQTNPATSTLEINTTGGALPAGKGATLKSNGDIDFSADTAASLNASNYQMNYIVCGTNGLQTVYDVRWNVATLTGWGKQVTVAARQIFVDTGKGFVYLPPVTLRTVVGM